MTLLVTSTYTTSHTFLPVECILIMSTDMGAYPRRRCVRCQDFWYRQIEVSVVYAL